MHPLGFNRIEPGTFAGQVKHEQTTPAFALDTAVVCADPLTNLLTGVPRRIVPNQNERTFALSRLVLGDPVQILTSDFTDRTFRHKAQEHLVFKGQIDSVTREGFAIRIVFRRHRFHQAQGFMVTPTVQRRLGKATPPDFVTKA